MDESMKQFQQELIEVEIEAERLLLARHQVIRLEHYSLLTALIWLQRI